MKKQISRILMVLLTVLITLTPVLAEEPNFRYVSINADGGDITELTTPVVGQYSETAYYTSINTEALYPKFDGKIYKNWGQYRGSAKLILRDMSKAETPLTKELPHLWYYYGDYIGVRIQFNGADVETIDDMIVITATDVEWYTKGSVWFRVESSVCQSWRRTYPGFKCASYTKNLGGGIRGASGELKEVVLEINPSTKTMTVTAYKTDNIVFVRVEDMDIVQLTTT